VEAHNLQAGERVEDLPHPHILLFTAPWSLPVPLLLGRLPARPGMSIVVIDVEQRPELAREFRVEVLPTMVLRTAVGERARRTGALSPTELAELARAAESAPGRRRVRRGS
jgi:hypothetical protein